MSNKELNFEGIEYLPVKDFAERSASYRLCNERVGFKCNFETKKVSSYRR